MAGGQLIGRLFLCMGRRYICRPIFKKQGRIHDTISRGGWAGAVIGREGAVRDAGYTTESVACEWAGAVMQKLLAKRQKSKGVTDGRTDQRTNGLKDRQTE